MWVVDKGTTAVSWGRYKATWLLHFTAAQARRRVGVVHDLVLIDLPTNRSLPI